MDPLLCESQQLDDQLLFLEENTVLTNTTEEIVNPSKIENEKLRNIKSQTKSKQQFNCDICHKTFSNCISFQRHKKKHENGEIHMKLKCNICGKRFQWSIALEEHLLNHSSYVKCDICDKFHDKSNLVYHKRTHKRKQICKVKCDLCGINCAKIRKHKRKIHNVDV